MASPSTTTPSLFKPYDPEQFNSLPDFELAAATPDTVIRTAQRCGEVLCRYGCHEILAICLLHKHFDLAADERLVRTWDGPKRAYALPIPTDAAGDALPWMWRFSTGSSGSGWYPTEYVESSPGGRAIYTILESFEPVFDELTEVFARYQLADTFGVAAHYANEGLTVDDNEQTVETSSISPRRLDLTVSQRPSSGEEVDATVTLFRWSGTAARDLVGAT